jgi:hypothetical protein
MTDTQLNSICAAIFMTGANPLSPEDAAEKAKNLTKAMSMALALAEDEAPACQEAEPIHVEVVETRRVYYS